MALSFFTSVSVLFTEHVDSRLNIYMRNQFVFWAYRFLLSGRIIHARMGQKFTSQLGISYRFHYGFDHDFEKKEKNTYLRINISKNKMH